MPGWFKKLNGAASLTGNARKAKRILNPFQSL